jgi:mono/diheme cytochrome c family protein
MTKPISRVSVLAYPALLCFLFAAIASPGSTDQALSTNKPQSGDPTDKIQAEEWASFQKTVLPFFSKHCFECHGPKSDDAEVRLDKLRDAESLAKGLIVLEKSQEMLHGHRMPPKKRPQPSEEEVRPVLAWLEGHSARVIDCSSPRNPGRVTLHRLNRAEYNNTIRDLLAVEFRPADSFPVDDAGYGFDNIGDVLSLSPLLLEKYLAAAEAVLEKAIFVDPVVPAPIKRWDALKAAGTTPPPPVAPPGGKGGGGRGGPATRVFAYKNNEVSGDYDFPSDGEYAFRVRAFSVAGPDKQRPKVAFFVGDKQLPGFVVGVDVEDASILGIKARVGAGKQHVRLVMLNGDEPPPPGGKTEQPEKAGDAEKKAGQPEKKAAQPEKKAAASQKKAVAKSLSMNLFFFEIEGPLEHTLDRMPESYKRVFVATPSAQMPKAVAAEKIIRHFAGRAYRRPVRDDEVGRLMKLWKSADAEGDPFDKSICFVLQAVLVSPHFLFRVESDSLAKEVNGIETVSEYALASRLSYFLWSSMPDDTLFDLAAKGQLRSQLDPQVRRMLNDPKSNALIENFAGQWLQLRMLHSASPDAKRFPDWDESLREAMIKETELFFSTIVKEDRSLLDFLDAKFTFVNERLAKHYGLPGVKGDKFQRVELKGDQRGGLLTQASILTITSHPHRTSPVLRGKWVLENLLDTPPPPPPPNVPALVDDQPGELKGTLRQRLEQHRANPACATCHSRLDPLGFALENFDAIGAWRTNEGDNPVDPSGTLPDGRPIAGPDDLKKYLSSRPEVFCRCVAQKMLTYALGRGLEPYDRCAADDIMAALKRNNNRFSVLITAIVHTDAFQKRQTKTR